MNAQSRPGAARGGVMAQSLGVEFPQELARVKEILGYYQESGPAAAWAAGEIKRAIAAAEVAWAEQDVVAMVKIYPTLQGIK